MSDPQVPPAANAGDLPTTPMMRSGLLGTEDWWAVWLGLGIVLIAYAVFAANSSIAWVAVAPAKWSTLGQLADQLVGNAGR